MAISLDECRTWESELDRLVSSIEKSARTGESEVVRAAIKAAEDALAKGMARIAELSTKAGLAKATVDQARAEFERVIRDKPLSAVAVAAATGFLLALLVRR